MNKSESKYFNTARLMNEALLKLLEEKEYEYITVKEICMRAGVNRSTFYLHYDSINDILDECMENADREFKKAFSVNHKTFASQIYYLPEDELILINDKFIMPYLNYVKNNRAMYKAAYMHRKCLGSEERMNHMSEGIIKPILSRFHIPEDEHKYWIKFYISGCHAIIQEWLTGDCKEPVEKIMDIMVRLIKPYRVKD